MTTRIPSEPLTQFAQAVLVAGGMTPRDAEATSEGLVAANLNGVDSHGVLRLPQYVQSLAAGEINHRPEVKVITRHGASASIDADGGYGYRPSFLAVETLAEMVAESGIGIVGVRNSHHFGMAGLYSRRLALGGAVALVWTNASAKIAPSGSITPTVGNNPLSWAVPRSPGHPPIVLDMAISTVAFGKIRLARAEGRPIPSDWGLDSSGAPTTDAEAAFAAGMLAPIGGYKGYGLSVVGEILAGVMTGSPFGLHGEPHTNPEGGVGHIFIAFRRDLFVPGPEFDQSVEDLVRQIKQAEVTVAGREVFLPGEIESRTAAERAAAGIPVSAELSEQLVELALSLGVRVPYELQVQGAK
jgi:L-2-hydroxycarboxylate dehydrogenase (NAD+)